MRVSEFVVITIRTNRKTLEATRLRGFFLSPKGADSADICAGGGAMQNFREAFPAAS